MQLNQGALACRSPVTSPAKAFDAAWEILKEGQRPKPKWACQGSCCILVCLFFLTLVGETLRIVVEPKVNG